MPTVSLTRVPGAGTLPEQVLGLMSLTDTRTGTVPLPLNSNTGIRHLQVAFRVPYGYDDISRISKDMRNDPVRYPVSR